MAHLRAAILNGADLTICCFRFIAASHDLDDDTIAIFCDGSQGRSRRCRQGACCWPREMETVEDGHGGAGRGTNIDANAKPPERIVRRHQGQIEAKPEAAVAELPAKAERRQISRTVPDGMSRPEELQRRKVRWKKLDPRATIEVCGGNGSTGSSCIQARLRTGSEDRS